jgi:hypothetical protein
MGSKRKELGFLASAVFAAGFVPSCASAQAPSQRVDDYVFMAARQEQSVKPPVSLKIYPLPKLAAGSFPEAASKDKPQIDIILPNKSYYEQKDNHSLDLGSGASAKFRGPMKLRVTVPF